MDRAPDRVPDGIEPIIAYRMWQYMTIDRGADFLAPEWNGAGSNWVVASCRLPGADPRHAAPVEDCTCGFYAFGSLYQVIEAFGAVPEEGIPGERGLRIGMVLGRVQLAGKIIEHELGYRAERARIAELIPVAGTERSVRRLAADLEVPIGPSIPPTPPAISRPRPPRPPPMSPSSIRKRVKEWVWPEAA